MSGDGIDPGLLGRLAGSLDEQGQALKSIQSAHAVIHGKVSSHEAQIESAHARIKTLEQHINGNGDDGLKTAVRLVQENQKRMTTEIEKAQESISKTVEDGHRRLEASISEMRADMRKDIEDINAWRKDLSGAKLRTLEESQRDIQQESREIKREKRERHLTLAMFAATFALSLFTAVGSCGQQASEAPNTRPPPSDPGS